MRIEDLRPDDDGAIRQAAAMLVAGFAAHWPEAWPDLESALAEVRESFEEGRISRVARGDDGTVSGWIGGIPEYDGRVWELHPLVVDPRRQGQGIGRLLVTDFEERARARGGLTVMLGTDDEDAMTTLGGESLFPNVVEHLANIKNLRRHPFEFYQKLGYSIVGVIPDADGLGKHDILMAKSLVR
jgi:aminoglycoside 6'-N-acetyltransferase I